MIRYPGGNFVSNYDWKDGIGPKDKRPVRLDFAWVSTETNQVGIDDFCRWAEKAGIEPMIAVNLGTGSAKDAGELVEYCNHPGGTYWSDLRIKNGHKEPYKIKYWCLGNEMEGDWQAGHMNAADYAKKAKEAAKIMHWVDPTIKLIACGSSYHMLPEYLEWDRIMLTEMWDFVDYLSTHYYVARSMALLSGGNTIADYLAAYKGLDDHIKNSVHALDYVKSKLNKKKDIPICLDEWNVWNFQDLEITSMEGLISMKSTKAKAWEVAPPICEEQYSLLDALVLGGLGITLLNNADRVEIACLAQLVNTIAPITTDKNGGILKQAIFDVFKYLSAYGRGVALQAKTEAPPVKTANGELPVVASSLVYDEASRRVAAFVLNSDENEDVEYALTLNGFGGMKAVKHLILDGKDLEARNTFDAPDAVKMREAPASGNTSAVLPKLSWNVIIFE
jgi:alpha-N-arabinofuranosidase